MPDAPENAAHDPEEVIVMFVRVPDAQMADKQAAEDIARELVAMVNEIRVENGGHGGPVELLFATRSQYQRKEVTRG